MQPPADLPVLRLAAFTRLSHMRSTPPPMRLLRIFCLVLLNHRECISHA